MEKQPRSVIRIVIYVVLILAGILIYAYGWQITDINLEAPQNKTRQKQVVRALRGLLSPDLFERDEESHVAYAHFLVPCAGSPPPQPEVAEGEPYITLSPYCGETKDQITIEGFNFRPYSSGFVRWTRPGGNARSLGQVRTDRAGHFKNQLRVPSVSASDEPQIVEAEIKWPVGTPRPSEAFKITLDRMIETIFLALMATTLGIVVAVPISFIAAHNLMRQIQTPLGSLVVTLLPLPMLVLVQYILKVMQAPQFLQDWLILRPVGDLALSLGNKGWLGVPILIVIFAVLYFAIMRYTPRPDRARNPWLRGLVRYVQMIFFSILFLFVSGLVSGVGTQIGLALSEVLGGILGNIVGTLAELLRLLLPAFGGLVIVFVLGSLFSDLLDALLNHIKSAAIKRALGLFLGALACSLLVLLIYESVFRFYNPGYASNELAPWSIYLTIGGAVLGGGLGLFLGASYLLPIGLIVYYSTRTVLNILRSIEPLIMAIVFAIWVSIGPFAGVLALSLHSIAALAKLYSEQVESIDPGPIEAITATGATRLQTIVYGVVPQIVPPYIAFTLYRWDINVRMSTIIGFVGGGGIGQILKQWIDLLQYRQAGVATLAIAIVVAALDYASAKTREKLV
jgi:phosphonate ABC transporter permease subunit PhnE